MKEVHELIRTFFDDLLFLFLIPFHHSSLMAILTSSFMTSLPILINAYISLSFPLSEFLQDDLTTTLLNQCRQSQYTVQRIIETAGDNEAVLFEALNVNDEIQKVLSKYEEMKTPAGSPKGPEPAMIPVAAEPDDLPSAGKEESLVRKPRSGSNGGNNDEMMDDLDEMIFGKKSGGTSEAGGQNGKKQQAPKDDLISF